MTLAIPGIVGAVLPLLARWMYRRWQRRDDPLEQHRRRYADIDEQIIARDSERITTGASADLDELERLRLAKARNHPPR